VGSDTIEVGFESLPPDFVLGEDKVICPGDTVFLNAPQTDNAILWETPDGASTESQYLATLPGIVTLTISNHCGVASDEILIGFDLNEPQVALDPVSICDGDSVLLDVTQPFDAIYEWNTGSTSSVLQIVTPGQYAVTVMTDCYQAEGSIEVLQSADCDPQIFVPNVFSPNGDGVNDVWEVLIDPSIDVIGIEYSVFDRWGNAVFRATSIPVEWDGSFKGNAVLPGVYVYVLKLIDEDEARTLSGSLTLVR
jgi:gliding motility-associated-like protein